jgi:hypothetical protein
MTDTPASDNASIAPITSPAIPVEGIAEVPPVSKGRKTSGIMKSKDVRFNWDITDDSLIPNFSTCQLRQFDSAARDIAAPFGIPVLPEVCKTYAI